MIRKQIYLEPEQNRALKQLSGQSGLPEAEIIRAAIDQHLYAIRRVRSDVSVWDEELAFLQNLSEEAVQQPRSWTRDELYER